MSLETKRNEKALKHLNSLKPYDGWSLDSYISSTATTLVMLKRRNVPLYKKGFEFIAYDEQDTKCVIGITHSIGDTEKNSFCRGIVLVDKNGVVSRDQKEVRVTLKKNEIDVVTKQKELNETREAKKRNLENARNAMRVNNRQNEGPSDRLSNQNVLPNLSEEQTSELARLGLMVIGGLTILKIFASLFFSVYILAVPLVVLYAMSTCPSNDNFDAKKELKRVLRGHHLPESHPDKPKSDWLSETVARVTASVATELATSLGYELSFFNLFGVCTFATVNVSVLNKELYWIGIFGTWKYLLQRDTETTGQQRQ